MKFYIETFGCKVNMYETNYMKKVMLDSDFFWTPNVEDADIVIVNTCTVTNTANSKCKKFIRRIKRINPSVILVAVGCGVQKDIDEYKNMDIDILIGNINKSKISYFITDYLKSSQKYIYVSSNRDLEFENMTIEDFEHVRAFIKIQDGCDNFCTYCIIPFIRGKCRSKNFYLIIKEAAALVKNGHKEIVLTGIHTGSYSDGNKDLVDLINELSKINGLKRIRLSSVEITELNDKFMEMLQNNQKFCNHLHIPLQSGSNNVLQKMNRKYDINYFINKVTEIRKIRPDISLTTDLIVGFPTETDEDFEETMNNLKKIKFSKIHVFPYSKRDGTAASNFKEVDSKVKKERVQKVLELSKELEKEYENLFKEKMVEVLIEEVKDGKSIGHTSNYLKVETPGFLKRGNIYTIKYKT